MPVLGQHQVIEAFGKTIDDRHHGSPSAPQALTGQNRSAHHHLVLTQDWHPSGHSSFATSHSGANPFESVAMSYGQQTLWPDQLRAGHCRGRFSIRNW